MTNREVVFAYGTRDYGMLADEVRFITGKDDESLWAEAYKRANKKIEQGDRVTSLERLK